MALKKLRKEQFEALEGTDILSTGEAGGVKFLRENGDGTCSWQTPPGGGVDTSGTPVANDFARFTDADTIEGRSYAEVRADLGLEIGTDVQAHSAVLDATTASFTTADKTKLDSIETDADVTDAANVTAAGALMDSELTNLAFVKALDKASTAEVTTGTNDTKAITPDALNGSDPTFDLVTYDAARGKVTVGGNLGATETINFNDETNYTGNLDDDITFTFANATSGDEVTLFLTYSGAQRTITWPTVTWLDNNDGSAPTTPAASGDVLVVTVRYIGSTYYASATGNYAVYS